MYLRPANMGKVFNLFNCCLVVVLAKLGFLHEIKYKFLKLTRIFIVRYKHFFSLEEENELVDTKQRQ